MAPVLTVDIYGAAFRKNLYESDFSTAGDYVKIEIPIDAVLPPGSTNTFRISYGGFDDIKLDKLLVLDLYSTAPAPLSETSFTPERPARSGPVAVHKSR